MTLKSSVLISIDLITKQFLKVFFSAVNCLIHFYLGFWLPLHKSNPLREVVAENFKFSGTVFRCIFFMIRGENISHFEFLGPHVVISKVKIWPIFVVWKKNSKIHVSGSKFEKLRFFKKFLRDQSHFFTQSSSINLNWNYKKIS